MPIARAHVMVVLAMSADGKIADRDRTAARFSSSQDLAHLERLVAQADAVLFGAATLRAYGTCLSVRQPDLLAQRAAAGQPLQPLQIVCSESGELSPALRFFQQPVPRWLLTSAHGANRWATIADSKGHFESIWSDLANPMDWLLLLLRLRQQGIYRLAVLGGGKLVAGLAEQDLIDELHLTLCPLLLGGQTAPTPFDGQGLPVSQARSLQLVQVRQHQNEVFLHYRRCHPEED
ncbi:MAG: RibD family protein [Leptolyngbyaceae cyanobacterium]